MANTFTRYLSKNVGTSTVVVVTVGASTQTTIIGLSLANTTTSPITVSAFITASTIDYYLIRNATVPVGGTLVVVGGDQKTVLVTNDALKVVSSTAASADVITSVLNIT